MLQEVRWIIIFLCATGYFPSISLPIIVHSQKKRKEKRKRHVKLAGRIASAMSVKHVLYIDWLSAAIAAAVCVCGWVGVLLI